MKGLIITIIMIVSSCVNGQHFEPTLNELLIEQYQAYKLECYNDSTIRYINPIPKGHSHVHYVNWYTEAQCNDNHIRTYWKHKKPTFDGFMNYLIKNQ